MPIEYLVDRNTNVSDDTFHKVLKIHLKAGFDVKEEPSVSEVQRRQKTKNFWKTMIENDRMTTEILSLIIK